MNNKEKFREQLLSQEKTNPEHQKNFQLEAKKMYAENLKKRQRFGYVIAGLLIAFFAFIFWLFAKIFEIVQIEYGMVNAGPIRLASTCAMFLSAALVALSLWPAIRGKIGVRFYPKVIRFVFWILILSITFLFFGVIEFCFDEFDKTEFSMNNVFDIGGAVTLVMLMIVMGVYIMLGGRIDRGDMKNKAKTLELEYRIAELEEKLNQSK
jgi:hypothetical protein